jgi:hypothetical protein
MAGQLFDLLTQLFSGGGSDIHHPGAGRLIAQVMGKHTKGHMSFKSGFSFVEGRPHPETMFRGGQRRRLLSRARLIRFACELSLDWMSPVSSRSKLLGCSVRQPPPFINYCRTRVGAAFRASARLTI